MSVSTPNTAPIAASGTPCVSRSQFLHFPLAAAAGFQPSRSLQILSSRAAIFRDLWFLASLSVVHSRLFTFSSIHSALFMRSKCFTLLLSRSPSTSLVPFHAHAVTHLSISAHLHAILLTIWRLFTRSPCLSIPLPSASHDYSPPAPSRYKPKSSTALRRQNTHQT